MSQSDPHKRQPVLTDGVALDKAGAAMILIHGRGASAESILTLTDELDHPEYSYLAPQAADHAWYPYSFLAPVERNEPYLSSALSLLEQVVRQVAEAGIARDKLILLGFSQGACLCLEYAARHPTRYGGVVALSGGLIGAPGTLGVLEGNFQDTPIFLGCSNVDPHIPVDRVQESTAILREMGAAVTERIYPGMGHTVNQDEIDFVQQLMDTVQGAL